MRAPRWFSATTIVTVCAVLMVLSTFAAMGALAFTQLDSRQAASKRITKLNGQLALQTNTIASLSTQVGSLSQGQLALQEQIRQLGAKPVVTVLQTTTTSTVPVRPTPASVPAAKPSPVQPTPAQPAPSTTVPAQPSPSTPPTTSAPPESCRLKALGVCVP